MTPLIPKQPLTLLIPDKHDPERDSVASCFAEHMGTVLKLGKFWQPPMHLASPYTRVYGPEMFCLVLQQKLGLSLMSPSEHILLNAPNALVQRTIRLVDVEHANALSFPCFVKSLIPKQIESRVYDAWSALNKACQGLEPSTQLVVSNVVTWRNEFRAFVLDGRVLDCQPYEGDGDAQEAARFVSRALKEIDTPRAVVVDVGALPNGFALIECNAAWGAGLNGCQPDKVLPAILAASTPNKALP